MEMQAAIATVKVLRCLVMFMGSSATAKSNHDIFTSTQVVLERSGAL